MENLNWVWLRLPFLGFFKTENRGERHIGLCSCSPSLDVRRAKRLPPGAGLCSCRGRTRRAAGVLTPSRLLRCLGLFFSVFEPSGFCERQKATVRFPNRDLLHLGARTKLFLFEAKHNSKVCKPDLVPHGMVSAIVGTVRSMAIWFWLLVGAGFRHSKVLYTKSLHPVCPNLSAFSTMSKIPTNKL